MQSLVLLDGSPMGVDKIPVKVCLGEERAAGINRNEEKERREWASSSEARRHDPPPTW